MKTLKKINWFNITILITAFISTFVLVHDFIFYAFIPLLQGKVYMMTYYGFFCDFIAICLLEVSIQYIKDFFKDFHK